MIPISVCMIAKNEEKNIGECLSRLSKYPFEIVVVDTGSTDRTKEIAACYTDKLYDFVWCDDFSAARNFSLSKAENDWVLIVDCDEFLEEIDLDAIYRLMEDYPAAVGQIFRHSLCKNNDGQNILTDLVERLFDKRLYHYEGIIHEQVVPLDLPSPSSPYTLSVFEIPMEFLHIGYQGSVSEMQKKADRDITLLLSELERTPDDPYIYYQLGEAYSLKGDYENAFQILDKGLYLEVDETLPYVKMMITSYGYSMIETGRYEQALGLEGVYDTFKYYADFVCMMGDVYLKLNKNQQALDQFLFALSLTDYSVEGANSYIPLHNIGCIYEAYGYYKEALDAYGKAADLGYAHSAERRKALEDRLKHNQGN